MQLTRTQYRVMAAVALVLLIGGVAAYGSSYNKGQIIASPTKKPVHVPAFKDYNGKYMKFTYLGTYESHKIDAKDNDLELSLQTADTNYEKHLAVTVSMLDGGRIENNSGYLLRQSQPQDYTSHQVRVDGTEATEFLKADGLEQTVFIAHNDKIAVLAFSTSASGDSLQPEVAALLKTFHWKD